jgi:hypothetical protein
MRQRIGEFLYIALRLWPLYLAVAVAAFVVSTASAAPAVDSLRAAVTWTVFSVLAAPGGHIGYTEVGTDRPKDGLKLLLVWVVWLVVLSPVAIAVLEWSDR